MILSNNPITLPAAVQAAISSLIKLLIALGVVALTGEQVAILLLFVDNALALIVAIVQRQNSTPTSNPFLPIGTVVRTPADEPTGVVVEATSSNT